MIREFFLAGRSYTNSGQKPDAESVLHSHRWLEEWILTCPRLQVRAYAGLTGITRLSQQHGFFGKRKGPA